MVNQEISQKKKIVRITVIPVQCFQRTLRDCHSFVFQMESIDLTPKKYQQKKAL